LMFFNFMYQQAVYICRLKYLSGKSYRVERLSTIDLLVLTSFDQLLLIMQTLFTFFTAQVTLMMRSTVLSLPLQLVFLVSTMKLFISKTLFIFFTKRGT